MTDALPPELEALARPGTVLLDKYLVEGVLGIGGMGAVVAATHLQLEERVAIKFLLGPIARDPDMVQRFIREGRSAIKIRSEHCVRVMDVGRLPDGSPYMVMEYLKGRDLDAVIAKSSPLAISAAVDYILQAGEALAEAHMLGIVHRDLKPANLFVAERADGSPCVKVLDFGISKQSAPDGGDLGMTKTQAIMGSPLYMSPEQMRSSKDVDARADIWALGAVLYESLCGRPPFDASSVTELCARILQDEPPSLSMRRPEVPPALGVVIGRALEKNRDRRYQNMAELAVALAPFGTQSARTSAERISRVIGGPRAPMRSHPDVAVAATLAQNAVAVSMHRQTSASSRGLLWIGGAVAVLFLLLVVASATAWKVLRPSTAAAVAADATRALANPAAATTTPPQPIVASLPVAASSESVSPVALPPTDAVAATSAKSAVRPLPLAVPPGTKVKGVAGTAPHPSASASASAGKPSAKPKDVFDDRTE